MSGRNPATMKPVPQVSCKAPLTLYVASTFRARLLGVGAFPGRSAHDGVVLVPCRSIHTFFLRRAIDVVFLDKQGRECRRIECMRPWRMAFAARAHLVVELPAGYCARHPDTLARIHAALQLRVFPRLSE